MQQVMAIEFKRLIAQHNNVKQYGVADIPSHNHNSLNSPPINYADITGVSSVATIQTITLTSDQILALHTTFIQLIPPPANALSVNIVDGITARTVFGTTAYTGANNLEFRYTNASGIKVTADIPSSFINSASSGFAHAPAVTAEFAPVTGGAGTNGSIIVDVPTANPAVGDGLIILTIHYRIVSFNQ